MLEHDPDPVEFYAAALACLAPGGRLILGVPSSDGYLARLVDFVLNAPPHHVTWWSDRALQTLVRRFRGEVLELRHAPVEPWERRLRSYAALSPKSMRRFRGGKALHVRCALAWLASPIAMRLRPPAATDRGATTVIVVRHGSGKRRP